MSELPRQSHVSCRHHQAVRVTALHRTIESAAGTKYPPDFGQRDFYLSLRKVEQGGTRPDSTEYRVAKGEAPAIGLQAAAGHAGPGDLEHCRGDVKADDIESSLVKHHGVEPRSAAKIEYP